jgi:hypothetical protein
VRVCHPAKPISDVRSLAGKWEGYTTNERGTFPVTMTANEDGSYSVFVPAANTTVTGVMQVTDGKARFRTADGATGTTTLYEGEGKRVLKSVRDDASVTTELRPAK